MHLDFGASDCNRVKYCRCVAFVRLECWNRYRNSSGPNAARIKETLGTIHLVEHLPTIIGHCLVASLFTMSNAAILERRETGFRD